MTPDMLEAGKLYPGNLPDEDAAVFEFSKEGPELRLFFSGITDDIARHVNDADCWLGLLRERDIAIVPWQIGDHMSGDAQFHVFLYPPETRPTPEILTRDGRYRLQLVLVDRASRKIWAVRHFDLSSPLSKELTEAIAYQLGNHIGREEYDAQVSEYQTRYADVRDAIKASPMFEKMQPI
ncbi:hypothetical protein [Noviherbaspirillum sp.]|uniref:hypothetical protein n=1 Tax=Noviherbaspirillum sp. TaxID=1926288 RepID=UPI002D67877E|nr:hypothetical protein [Noviherbaspirillum sp.]HZW20541.1 hypothetical protein [Noviherbaspirillum sp.]